MAPLTPYLATNPILNAYSQSDLFGKAIFISLFGLSILTWVVFLYKLWLTQSVKKNAQKIQEVFSKKRLNPLSLDLTLFPHHNSFPQPFVEIYRILKFNTLELLNKNRLFRNGDEDQEVFLSPSDMGLIEAHLMTTISCQTKQLEKNLFILSTVVSLAPFLGLLGTVWGILDTFSILQQGNSGNANELIMGGLSMALGTTVLGLLVAIPALISYNYLRSAIEHFSTEMDDFSNLLMASVEMQYRKVDI